MTDHPPDTDDDDTAEDPDLVALVELVATALVNAAHEFAESTDDPITHPSWDELPRLERNLFMAGVIGLATHHHRLLEALLAVIHADSDDDD